jgi:hypothetical protein
MTLACTVPAPAEVGSPAAGLRWSRRDWLALALLALMVLLFFWRILTPRLADRASFPPGDFSYQFWAFSTLEARELGQGRLPLWNPYTYAGAPFWADIQSAVLYPFSGLTLLLSAPWGFSLFALECEAVLHFWLAGVFTFLFVRRITSQRAPALLAAIGFAFGGYLTAYPSQQLAVLETDVWLPLLLYWTDRALVDRSAQPLRLRANPGWLAALAAGLTLGVSILAGHPQSAMFVFYAFTLYSLFLALAHRRPAPYSVLRTPYSVFRTPYSLLPTPYSLLLTPVAHWVVVAAVGLGLSAAAWLPGLEYMQQSVRAAGQYDQMAGGFPLSDPIQLLLPGSVSHYSPLYAGVLSLLLGVWAGLAIRRREIVFWAALAAGALLLSFGGETFLYSPLYLLAPGFGTFRDQERAAFIFSFALAVLAGYGFKYQMTNDKWQMANDKSQAANRNQPVALERAVRWLLAGSVGMVLLFFYGLNNAGWQDNSPFNLLLTRSVWLTILLALSWGLLRAIPGRSESTARPAGARRAWVSAGCLSVVALDLFTANWQTNLQPVLPETETATPAVVQAIQKDAAPGDIFRVYNEYRLYENYGVPFALEDSWGASPLRPARYDQLYRTLRMERLWQLLNVKYVITWRKELYAPSDIIYQEPAGKDTTYVHRLRTVAPRAWLVYQAEQPADDQALARLDAPDFDPGQAALLAPGPARTLSPLPSGQAGTVQVTRRAPGSLELDVTSPAEALLVLSETYYPGWQARLDDSATSVERVDYTLRGVFIAAGQHHLQLSFQPASWLWGSVISGITLLTVVAVAWGGRLRRRRG